MSGFEKIPILNQSLEIEERTWLPRHGRGDESAFGELVQAYQDPVYGYLYRCGINKQQREDLFQDIFMRIHLSAASYQPHRPLRPWIFTIAANVVRNHFRSQVFNQVEETEHESGLPPLDETLANCQALDWLELAIPRLLPFNQAEVLILTTIKGLQQRDVAEILDLPLNTVKTHLSRARKTLTLAWMQYNGQTAVEDSK